MNQTVRYIGLSALIAFAGVRADAQVRTTIAVQVGRGWGDGTGGDYLTSPSVGGEGNISLRVPVFAKGFAVVGQFEFDGLAMSHNYTAACVIHVGTSGCIPPFPDFAGATAAGGIMISPFSRLEVRAVAGPGLYQASGCRVFGIMRGADAALYPLPWLGIAGGWKHVVIPHYNAQRLDIARGFVAVRLRCEH